MTYDQYVTQWQYRQFVCVLGSGLRPLSNENKDKFLGLETIPQIEATNVDIRNYPTTDIIQDLSLEHWDKLPSNYFDVVIAEHVAEHVPNRLWFVNECLRITKSNGLLIIEVPNWKHDSAHCTLEHYTTWGRAIFNDSYINNYGQDWKIEKVVYRVSNPFTWKSTYIKGEFLGREIDRFTSMISGLRFFIRVIK